MITIREATPEDNDVLQELNRIAPMRGNLTIRVERIPDFFAINRRIGPYTTMVACRENRIAGVLTVARHSAYVNGEIREVGVIRDVKIDPAYRGTTALYRLIYTFLQYALQQGWDIIYATALRGNLKVISLMGGRAGLPAMIPAGYFIQYNILPARWYRKRAGIKILAEDPSDELAIFLDRFYCNYQLGPVITRETLQDTMILSAWKNDMRVAAIVLQDTSSFRANVVENWSLPTGMLIRLWQLLYSFLPIPVPPKKGKELRTLYVRYLAVTKGNEPALNHLLQRARKMAWDGRYTFLALGLHKSDPLCRLTTWIPAIPARLYAFVLSLKKQKRIVQQITSGVLFDDFTLI